MLSFHKFDIKYFINMQIKIVKLKKSCLSIRNKYNFQKLQNYMYSNTTNIKTNAKFTKIVHPGDVQFLNFVKGGLIFKLMESTAAITASRHCMLYGLKPKPESLIEAKFVGLERIEMLGTARIGDILEFFSESIYAEDRLVRILVSVYSRNIEDTERKLLARGWLWHTAIESATKESVPFDINIVMPKPPKGTNLEISKQTFLAKRELFSQSDNIKKLTDVQNFLIKKPEEDMCSSNIFINSEVCDRYGNCKPGDILWWIDEFAGILATFHTRKPIVTVSLDNLIFFGLPKAGQTLTLSGRGIFTSNRTIDLQIIGSVDNPQNNQITPFVQGFITWVLIRQENDNYSIPNLKLNTDEEKELFEERNIFYTAKKALLNSIKNTSENIKEN